MAGVGIHKGKRGERGGGREREGRDQECKVREVRKRTKRNGSRGF